MPAFTPTIRLPPNMQKEIGIDKQKYKRGQRTIRNAFYNFWVDLFFGVAIFTFFTIWIVIPTLENRGIPSYLTIGIAISVLIILGVIAIIKSNK